MPFLSRLIPAVLLFAVATSSAMAQEPDWQRYDNPRFGFRIDLPMVMFEVANSAENGDGLSLAEVGGAAQLDVYGANIVEELTITEFGDVLAEADRIADVTYRAKGDRWLVMSGHYRRDEDERQDLIFYAKFIFNVDRSAFSAFEISYPLSDKQRFDRIVARLEKSLRAPD